MVEKQLSSLFHTTGDSTVEKSPFFAPHPPKHQLITTPKGSLSLVKDIDEEEKSSVLAASFNLCNNIIGAGIVGIPFAISQCSLLLGISMVVFFGVCTVKTLRLLIETAKHVDVPTYERLGEASFGKAGYNLVSISMFVFAYGAMVGYLMIIKTNLSFLLGVEEDDVMMKNAVLTVSSLLIILPISLQRDMGNLAKTSTISVIFDCILVAIVVYFSPELQTVEERGGIINVIKISKPNIHTFFVGIGVLCFAFVCQHSSFIIASSLENPTKKRWNIVTGISLTTCATLALAIGVAGYLGFTERTNADILINLGLYDIGVDKTVQYAANVAKGLLCSSLFFVYPTELFVARHVCVVMLFEGRRAHEGDVHSVLKRKDRRVTVTTTLYLLTLLPALLVDDLGNVLSLTGSLGGATLSYLGPGLFHLAVHGKDFLDMVKKYWGPEFVNCYLYKGNSLPGKNKKRSEHEQEKMRHSCIPLRNLSILSWYLLLMPIWCRIASRGKQKLKEHEQREAVKSPLPYAFGNIIHHKKSRETAHGKLRKFRDNGEIPRVESLPALLKPKKNPAAIKPYGSFEAVRAKKRVGFADQDSLGNHLSVNEKELLLSEHRPISAGSFSAASFEVIRGSTSEVIFETDSEDDEAFSNSTSSSNHGDIGRNDSNTNYSHESYESDLLSHREMEIPGDNSSIYIDEEDVGNDSDVSDGSSSSSLKNPIRTVSTYSKYDNIKASSSWQENYGAISIAQWTPGKQEQGEEDPQDNSPTVLDFFISCSFILFGFVAAFAGVFSTIQSTLSN